MWAISNTGLTQLNGLDVPGGAVPLLPYISVPPQIEQNSSNFNWEHWQQMKRQE